MALRKEYKTEHGISASHWQLDSFHIYNDLRMASFSFGLYYDENFKSIYSYPMDVANDKYDLFVSDVEQYGYVLACEKYALENYPVFENAVTQTSISKEE